MSQMIESNRQIISKVGKIRHSVGVVVEIDLDFAFLSKKLKAYKFAQNGWQMRL